MYKMSRNIINTVADLQTLAMKLQANEDGRFNTGRLFVVGGDDTGANIMLHYVGAAGAQSALYFHYNDGGTIEGEDSTADDLWGPSSDHA